MRPCCASRRVSRESGEVFVSSLHLHNLPPTQVSVGTEPLELSSLFFPFLPLPVYPRVAPLSICFSPRVTSPKRTPPCISEGDRRPQAQNHQKPAAPATARPRPGRPTRVFRQGECARARLLGRLVPIGFERGVVELGGEGCL
jgi:hypothetical protein